jgi:hypothetical protein
MEEIARTLAVEEMLALVWTPVIPLIAERPESSRDVSKKKHKRPGERALSTARTPAVLGTLAMARDTAK